MHLETTFKYVSKNNPKMHENLEILQVVRGSGHLRGQVWGDVWQLGRQEGVKKVS